MIPTPRTPTPFKNALAAQEKMHGPLKMEVRVLLFLAAVYSIRLSAVVYVFKCVSFFIVFFFLFSHSLWHF